MVQDLPAFADQLLWKNPDLDLLGGLPESEYPLIAQILQGELRKQRAKGKLVLPDLRAFKNDAVAVFSDYAGEGSGRFYTYAALVCGYRFTGAFNDRMREIRKEHRLGEKEIAFKDLGMGQVRRAVPRYLNALDGLPGFLCVLAVDKRVDTVIAPPESGARKRLAEVLANEGLGTWKPAVAEKLLRVVHFTAFLTALLTHDGQKVLWVTDDDAICPNQNAHGKLLSVFDRVLRVYTRPGCQFPRVCGAKPFAPRALELLDLLSAPDLAAGAIDPCLPLHGSRPDGNTLVKAGADKVLQWLAIDGIGLKKMIVMIRHGPGIGAEAGIVELG